MKNLYKTVNKGFTLLELLVVIGIIGVLVSLITVSFSNAQKTSRDSRRRQDLVSIQNAMEQYYAANNFAYPAANCSLQSCTALQTYMSNGVVPTDPLNTTGFQYTYVSAASGYTVTANLEKSVTPLTVTNLQ